MRTKQHATSILEGSLADIGRGINGLERLQDDAGPGAAAAPPEMLIVFGRKLGALRSAVNSAGRVAQAIVEGREVAAILKE